MGKNSCNGMSQADLILALGIPKSTYYDYLDVEGYPLNESFGVQKAWVDARQVENGAKAEQPSSRRPARKEEEGPSQAEQIKAWELRAARAKALKAEAELDEALRVVLSTGGEVYLARRLRGIVQRLQKRMGLVCVSCRGPLAEAFDAAVAELDLVERQALEELTDASVAGNR